ncbi:COX assembly mitochondrial protein 1 [Psilocybe cubensis]|uniref:COX assembly mitochondrial protein n=2 Tax=Psilocybe cubensis TaxID=181762 RepID=A0A8H8CMS2_PSICU|nr:COX assembly mitochondrial protein 1 [Psilocybe cubensis]KAH9483741.1 COX assembly mitochondrial protein 1 [Psilocybe cubensis]
MSATRAHAAPDWLVHISFYFTSPYARSALGQKASLRPVCQEFIEALERCHANGWTKFIGACNQNKDDLNHCLRTERLTRTKMNREKAKLRRDKTDQALQEFRAL